MSAVIQEVARRTGRDEALIQDVLQCAVGDTRDFLGEKKGYNLWFPNLGTFSFRVSFLPKYIEMQRRQLAYWRWRLQKGIDSNINRTVLAATENEATYVFRITEALTIKSEYLETHCKYNKTKTAYMERTANADINRLAELLNVEVLIAEFEADYQAKKADMPEMPIEGILPLLLAKIA
jgi:hypothetical protein